MLDPTPDRKFDTELQAVWYCANYYYKASYEAGVEYGGVIYKQVDGKYGYTVRKSTSFLLTTIRFEDMPVRDGQIPTAIWHSHLPASACRDGELTCLVAFLDDAVLRSYRSFSGKDKRLAQRAHEHFKKLTDHKVVMYLFTHDLIKRYDPSAVRNRYKEWKKDPAGNMKALLPIDL